MPLTHPRLLREQRTMLAMVTIYCQDHHGRKGGLCVECQGLFDYATSRLERCRFQPNKPTCVKCPVHCYKPEPREQVRQVMKYSGPKMLWRHPILAVLHLIDSRAGGRGS